MRSFERTPEKARMYEHVLRDTHPVGILWGRNDPALPSRTFGVQARLAAGLDELPTVPGKHFLQEDFPDEIAAAVESLVSRV
jgi:haloalkane dehalogenase